VLVGPNNSGKSLALREIETWCTSSEQARKVIDTIEVDFPTDIETAKALLEPFIAEASEDPVSENGEVSLDWNFIMHRPSLGPGQPMQGDRFFQKQINLSMERNLEGNMRSYLTRWHTIRLDGRRRFELTDEMEAGDLGGKPANHLVQLAQDSAARDLVRNLTL